MDKTADIAIVGGGIIGLAHAYFALKKGYRVVLFERDERSVGASIRNFGLIWPIGQPPGKNLERALRSREHWKELSRDAGFWMNHNGSLHVARHDDELSILENFVEKYPDHYTIKLVTPATVKSISPIARVEGLKAGLYSTSESTVYAREALTKIPEFLENQYGLIVRRGNAVREVTESEVKTSREGWAVNHTFICNGADFETLYPDLFEDQRFQKCKLQMLRLKLKAPIATGPTLCGGLTLRHYGAFSGLKGIDLLKERFDQSNPELHENGIHVMVGQAGNLDLIVGDSHHYARTHDPFEPESINTLILDYMREFTDLSNFTVEERWHGIYPKFDGAYPVILKPERNVTIVNGFGGAGMTLSFGVAEEIVNSL